MMQNLLNDCSTIITSRLLTPEPRLVQPRQMDRENRVTDKRFPFAQINTL